MLTFKEFHDTYKAEEEEKLGYYNIKVDKLPDDVRVDCSKVNPLSTIRLSGKDARSSVALYNCDKLNFDIEIEKTERTNNIQVYGNGNQINVFYANTAFVEGDNNIIKSLNRSYSSVRGNNNILYIRGHATGNCEGGEDNVINLHTYGNCYIREKCVNSSIVAHDESEIENYSFTSSILCFDRTFCRTVKCKKVEGVGDSVVSYWSEKNGKTWCREPVDDKSGYFYKAVSKNLTPLLWNDDDSIVYAPGTYVYPNDFLKTDSMCGEGIHFFGTIVEAVDFASFGWIQAKSEYEIVKLKVDFEDIAPIAQSNYEGKMRARKVYVDSIVPKEEYAELKKRIKVSYDF